MHDLFIRVFSYFISQITAFIFIPSGIQIKYLLKHTHPHMSWHNRKPIYKHVWFHIHNSQRGLVCNLKIYFFQQ